MNYEIKEYPHTKVTERSKKIEAECKVFDGKGSIFARINSHDVMYMMRGWFESKATPYYMRIIGMEMMSDGLQIKIPVADVDDIRRYVHILGKPSEVEEGDNGSLYAIWIRNIVEWF